ncbi:MAG: hypothetical protein KJ739_03300 [Nitrospinae bacterium]|nr:hypothetical protein [Nitrospinota bacterium]
MIELTYQKDKIKDIDSETEKGSFTQDYKLRYQGFVYSPRLLMYNIGGTFRKEDSKTDESSAGRTDTTAKSRDYNLKLDFIQGTKYPFTIYKERFELPTWTMQPTQTFQTRQTSDRYGLFGNAFLGKGINLRYDMREDDTKTTGRTEGTDQRNRSFMFGVDKRKDENFIDASYTYRHNLEKIKNEFEAINDARVSFGLKPGKDTRFNMNINYNDNSFYEFTTTTLNMNFTYVPSSDFNSNLTLYANRIKQTEKIGNFVSLFGNATYKISPYLTTNQSLMLYKSAGDFGNDSTESLTPGLVFTKQMPGGVTVSADTSINVTAQQFETSKNRNSMSYSIGGRVSKFFEDIKSEINGGGSYYIYRSSLKGKTARYAFNGGLTSRFIQNLTLQSLLNFSEEETIGDETEGASFESKTKRLTSDNSLGYFMQLGFRGSLDAKVGTIFESGTTQRTFRYATLTGRYSLRRNLSLNAGLNLYKESISKTQTLIGSLGVEYRLRAIRMSLRNGMWNEKGPTGTKTRSTIFFQVSRPF